MSEKVKNDFNAVLKSEDECGGDIFLIIVLLSLFGGFGNNENPRINELEKKVARLEGQISMIGGKHHESYADVR